VPPKQKEGVSVPTFTKSDKITLIAKLQAHTKAIIIKAEEMGIGEDTFPQPLLEQRSALDHLMRTVLAAEPDACQRTPAELEQYEEDCQSKALGHMYRAFFDAADWLSIELREGIRDCLKPYAYDEICEVFPEYPSWRASIFEIGRRISVLRNEKDIAAIPGICDQIEDYHKSLNTLEGYRVKIDVGLADLDKVARERRNAKIRGRWWDVAKVVLGAVVGGLVGFLTGKVSGSP